MGLVIVIFLMMTVLPVSAGDGVTRYWGVIVGISDYQTVSDLNFAADDASSLNDLLLLDSCWDASNITLIQDSQATRSAVENAIDTMAFNSGDAARTINPLRFSDEKYRHIRASAFFVIPEFCTSYLLWLEAPYL